ncbi:hypothetical protein [Corynebacterium lowii]|uniref:Telomeric repeat-binding factor 2 n=1 Tax=Corynebacterium lowii TaxID=1544413 RepID=A0A0Q0ZAH4_9CORY|nr:hypothetical protein [Corynebacterium lowii]KQB86889.1 hypothetical protein Clow_01100 [Corynebacterium lowii]MDP9851577.1 hypothetical protein [Corynebacterium lowii]
MNKNRRTALAGTVACCALVLTACSQGGEGTVGDPEGSIEVTTSETPAYQPQDVDTIVAENTGEPVVDTGLNVRWHLQGTVSGNAGGSIITVEVTNLNDVAIPQDTIGDPTLTINGGTIVDRLDAEASGVLGQDGLDRPLGAHATTNLRYAFDVSPGNLYNAAFEIGNVRFEGSL